MARNGSGTMSVINTFVAGNTITAAGHNQNNTDIAAEITNSVAVDGQSTMTGQFKAANGTKTAPGVTFGSDLDTGIYRIGVNNLGISCGDTKIIDVTTTGVAITGTLTPSGAITLTAGQIAFPATQSASSDVNTLDDYEEGTFTPALKFGGNSTGLTYTTQLGSYVKIGKLVYIEINIQVNSNGSSTGTATITGLPFTSNATTNASMILSVGDLNTTNDSFVASVSANGTAIQLTSVINGDLSNLTETEIADGSFVSISGNYIASA